ncbi:MAG: DUF6531 domain-containing protein [Candidatus Competibacter sp.]
MVKPWGLSPTGQCIIGNTANVFNFGIHRYRAFECQVQAPFKYNYVNYYNYGTGQSDIWSCYYKIKGQVVGNPLLTGCTEGNPCNVRNGDKSETETDYRGPALSFVRYYHSLAQGASGELGIGWSHSYSDRLSLNGAGLSGVIFGSGYQVPLLAKQGGTTHYQSSEPPAVEVHKIPEGWALYRENGGRDTFDLQGRLLRREEPNGHSVSIVRDPATGRLQQVRDAAGRALTFEYDPASGRLTALTDPAGGRITFGYTGNLLARVDFPDGSQRRYLYEDARFPYALTGIIDESGGRFGTYTYDAAGRAASSEHAGGTGKVSLQYVVSSSAGTVTTTVTDALNQRRIYYYLSYPPNRVNSITRQCADCGSGLVRSYTYSGIYPASIRDERGVTTTYVYDAIRELETSRTEAAGTPQARTIATQWHPTLRLPAKITEPTRRTDFSYDERGNLLARTETALDTGVARTWRYTYDADGNRLSEDGPREDVADVTAYEYWPADASCPGAGEGPGMDKGCRGRLRRATDPAGHVTEYLKYDAHGQLLRRRDPNGAEGVYAYDARGRLTARTEAGLATAYRYDPRGLLDRITLPSGAVLNYQYDAAHRLIGIQDNLGNRASYTLDAAGNRLKEQLYDPGNTLARQITREFDALSRMKRESWGAQP